MALIGGAIILGGKTNSALNALGEYRKKLLDEIHARQKRIDCLDHLIYMLGKSEL